MDILMNEDRMLYERDLHVCHFRVCLSRANGGRHPKSWSIGDSKGKGSCNFGPWNNHSHVIATDLWRIVALIGNWIVFWKLLSGSVPVTPLRLVHMPRWLSSSLLIAFVSSSSSPFITKTLICWYCFTISILPHESGPSQTGSALNTAWAAKC